MQLFSFNHTDAKIAFIFVITRRDERYQGLFCLMLGCDSPRQYTYYLFRADKVWGHKCYFDVNFTA